MICFGLKFSPLAESLISGDTALPGGLLLQVNIMCSSSSLQYCLPLKIHGFHKGKWILLNFPSTSLQLLQEIKSVENKNTEYYKLKKRHFISSYYCSYQGLSWVIYWTHGLLSYVYKWWGDKGLFCKLCDERKFHYPSIRIAMLYFILPDKSFVVLNGLVLF